MFYGTCSTEYAATLSLFRSYAVRLAVRPTAITNGGTSRVTAVLFAMNVCAPTSQELMNAGEAAHAHPVADDHVTAERAAVRQHSASR